MLSYILIASLFSYGYCACFWEGMLLSKIGAWAENNLPKKVWMPLGGCSICCSFWVSTLMYWLFWGDYWVHWLTIAVCSVGFNAIVVNLINKIEGIAEIFSSPNQPE